MSYKGEVCQLRILRVAGCLRESSVFSAIHFERRAVQKKQFNFFSGHAAVNFRNAEHCGISGFAVAWKLVVSGVDDSRAVALFTFRHIRPLLRYNDTMIIVFVYMGQADAVAASADRIGQACVAHDLFHP